MPTEDEGSVTYWLSELKAGASTAAQPLWERYFDPLVRLARTKLRAAHRSGADADEEDAALSAFDNFCRGVAQGRFPQLADRDDLWRLLVTITTRKVVDQSGGEAGSGAAAAASWARRTWPGRTPRGSRPAWTRSPARS